MKRIEGLDGLRTYSCLGIVAMHIWMNGKYNCTGFLFENIIPSLTNLVFLFMAISAFGMCCGYYKKVLNKELDIVEFYKKRYKRIFPFFALLCVMDFATSPSINSFYELIADFTLCFGLIPNANITVIGVGWFLGVVFVFYFIFPFFCFLLENKRRAWLALFVSYIINHLCGGYFNADRTSIAYCFVYFLVGGLVFLYKEQILQVKNIKWISALCTILSVVLYYNLVGNTLIIVSVCASILIFTLFVEKNGVLINSFTKKIGNISFEVYLCHMFFYRILEKLGINKLFSNDYINYVFTLLLVVICAAIFASIMQMIINKLSVLGKGVNNGR